MWNAAVINCCDESRKIANHSAAKTNNERLAVEPCGSHLIANRAGVSQCLRFLACRNRDQRRTKSGCRYALLYPLGKEPRDIAVGNNRARFPSQKFTYVLADVRTQA